MLVLCGVSNHPLLWFWLWGKWILVVVSYYIQCQISNLCFEDTLQMSHLIHYSLPSLLAGSYVYYTVPFLCTLCILRIQYWKTGTAVSCTLWTLSMFSAQVRQLPCFSLHRGFLKKALSLPLSTYGLPILLAFLNHALCILGSVCAMKRDTILNGTKKCSWLIENTNEKCAETDPWVLLHNTITLHVLGFKNVNISFVCIIQYKFKIFTTKNV
jgi:hypothetical protein